MIDAYILRVIRGYLPCETYINDSQGILANRNNCHILYIGNCLLYLVPSNAFWYVFGILVETDEWIHIFGTCMTLVVADLLSPKHFRKVPDIFPKSWLKIGQKNGQFSSKRWTKTHQFLLCRFFSHISHWDWSLWSHQNRSSRCWQCVWYWDAIILSARRIWNICRNRIMSDFCLYHVGCDIIYVMDLQEEL